MRSKFIWLVISCIMVITLVLASCGGEKEQQGGGTLYVVDAEPSTFDPADAINATNTDCSFTNETLSICHWEWPAEKCGFYGVEMDSISDPETWLAPNLALSFERPDLQTTIFHLRKGVKWNAGLDEARELVGDREFTSDDVVWHFNYVMNSPKHEGRWGNIESITATDKYTVEVKAKEPDIFLTTEIAAQAYTYIHCKEVYEEYGNFADWRNNVGTGPFIRTEFETGTSITYEKNPDYWGHDEKNPDNSIPYVDGVKVLFITDLTTQVAAFRTGKIDQLRSGGISRHHVADLLETNPDIGVAKYITGNSYWSLRNDVEPFNDIRVRKAMNMAINRQEILEDFYGGEGSAWNNPYPPIYTEVYLPLETLPDDIKEIYTYNPEGAKELLAEAGYPNGFKTELVYYAATGSDIHEKNALIKEYLAAVGIDVELKLVDSATNRAMRYGFTYPQMYGDGMGVNYPEHFYQVWYVSTAPWNRCRVNDSYIDETVEKALKIGDFDERRALFRELDMYVLRNCFDLSPVNGYDYTIWQPWLKNYNGQRCLVFLGSATVYARVWIDQELKESMGY